MSTQPLQPQVPLEAQIPWLSFPLRSHPPGSTSILAVPTAGLPSHIAVSGPVLRPTKRSRRRISGPPSSHLVDLSKKFTK